MCWNGARSPIVRAIIIGELSAGGNGLFGVEDDVAKVVFDEPVGGAFGRIAVVDEADEATGLFGVDDKRCVFVGNGVAEGVVIVAVDFFDAGAQNARVFTDVCECWDGFGGKQTIAEAVVNPFDHETGRFFSEKIVFIEK